ncbi:MAG: zinc ribbon domain-containing protein [bacterium]
MPIYEFYCATCNTVYSFLARKVSPDARPACPACRTRTLQKQFSIFAATTGKRAPAADAGEGGPGSDPATGARMQQAMQTLAGEVETLDADNPRQAADLMRKFSKAAGMNFGPGMQEALNRMESGEDPEAIEAELGDRIEQEAPGLLPEEAEGRATGRNTRRQPLPRRDQTLYEM